MEEDHEFRVVSKLCRKKCPSSDERSDPNSPNKFSRENPGYVLRENPKRSWRAAAPMANVNVHHQEKLIVCRQCGRGFHSLKALCGHMGSHSDGDRGLKEDDSVYWNTDHSQSSYSEIDQEQEELAMCLMMLSRESGKWVNMNSSTCVVESENSDSGYFMNETEKVESNADQVEVSSMEEVPIKNSKKKKEAPLSVYKFCDGPIMKKKKKKKGHVCPICHKVYKSGQALGGHKRSHFLVSSEERNHHVSNSKTRHHFLDLNLPPPMEE